MNDNFNPLKQHVFLLNWLTLILILVIAMIIIGGITRITDSGLSMVEWRPILGFLPPLNNQEWERVFDLYKNTPEYSYYNKGMLLSDFKFIFFWEYFHRLWGRIIGILFILPFIYLIVSKKIDKFITVRLLVILFFGSLQAFIGWWMVKSGLMYNTYPLMNDSFFPSDYLSLGVLDPFENPGSAQFHHRHLGFISLVAIVTFFARNFYQKKVFLELILLITFIIIQFILGIYILLNYVPNLNASFHQIGAVLIFLTMIKIIHTLNIKT